MDGGLPTAPRSPNSDPTSGSSSAPFLEQRSNADGLVELLPRNYDNRDIVNVRKDTTGSSAMATPEPSPPDEDMIRLESREVLKNSGRISSRPRHIDLPPSTFNEIRAGGPQTPGSASVFTNTSWSTPTEITPGLQVLVVDDDRMTRLLMARMLERLRCVVTTAANGKQALQLLLGEEKSAGTPAEDQEQSFPSDGREVPRDWAPVHTASNEGKFAITFLDNQMPIMSGVEMVKKLRILGREDLIVGVTGNALLQDQEEYIEAGADQCVRIAVGRFEFSRLFFSSILTKPVREENLRGMLSIADERRKTRARDSSQYPIQPQLPPFDDVDESTTNHIQ